MAAQIVNLIVDQGSTFSTIIELVDANNNPLLLAGYSGNSQIRKHYASVNISATFNVAVNASYGIVTLSLDANTTGSLYQGRYVYDVILTDIDGKIARVAEGQVTIIPSVTHV